VLSVPWTCPVSRRAVPKNATSIVLNAHSVTFAHFSRAHRAHARAHGLKPRLNDAQYFAGSGNKYAAGNFMSDAISEATIVDAVTGQPVVRASVVQ